MQPVNWPPLGAPSWPPPNYVSLSWASYDEALADIQAVGGTVVAPTSQEQNTYFKNARCDEGHTVQGVIVVWPNPAGGTIRYPFARCTNGAHSQGLVLWVPFYVNFQ